MPAGTIPPLPQARALFSLDPLRHSYLSHLFFHFRGSLTPASLPPWVDCPAGITGPCPIYPSPRANHPSLQSTPSTTRFAFGSIHRKSSYDSDFYLPSFFSFSFLITPVKKFPRVFCWYPRSPRSPATSSPYFTLVHDQAAGILLLIFYFCFSSSVGSFLWKGLDDRPSPLPAPLFREAKKISHHPGKLLLAVDTAAGRAWTYRMSFSRHTCTLWSQAYDDHPNAMMIHLDYDLNTRLTCRC